MNLTLPARKHTRLYLIGALILVIGFGSAGCVYLTAPEPPENPFYEFEHSKRYRHDLEAYGGKVTILADDLSRSLAGLLQGKSLAGTVAALTVIIALPFFLNAYRLSRSA